MQYTVCERSNAIHSRVRVAIHLREEGYTVCDWSNTHSRAGGGTHSVLGEGALKDAQLATREYAAEGFMIGRS
jgi:hypothetical protein